MGTNCFIQAIEVGMEGGGSENKRKCHLYRSFHNFFIYGWNYMRILVHTPLQGENHIKFSSSLHISALSVLLTSLPLLDAMPNNDLNF